MTTILTTSDADPAALDGQHVAVVGYGNQGRSWALNLRDSGVEVSVHTRADASREVAAADGFAVDAIPAASEADVACLLVPDDVVGDLDLDRRGDALTVVASGYPIAFGGYAPEGDLAMVAPRMLGPEVRACYEEGVGFITAVGVQQDRTGTARSRTLAVASAIGGLVQGAIELTPRQEAVLDLGVEQVLAPALRRMNLAFTALLAEQGIPIEAILTELFLSGEMERTFRRLRLEGYAGQMAHHSPTSRYGQLSRADRYDDLPVEDVMRAVLDDITSGRFAHEWDAERGSGYATLRRLEAEAIPPELVAWERELRQQLGERRDT